MILDDTVSIENYTAVVAGLKIQHNIELKMMNKALRDVTEEFRSQVATLEREKEILTKQIYDINNKRNSEQGKTTRTRAKLG